MKTYNWGLFEYEKYDHVYGTVSAPSRLEAREIAEEEAKRLAPEITLEELNTICLY